MRTKLFRNQLFSQTGHSTMYIHYISIIHIMQIYFSFALLKVTVKETATTN